MDEFAAMGATVIGLSADDIGTLKEFSVLECRNAFPVGVASAELIKAYDVSLVREGKDLGVTSRTSYVIAPDGRIAMVHSDRKSVVGQEGVSACSYRWARDQ